MPATAMEGIHTMIGDSLPSRVAALRFAGRRNRAQSSRQACRSYGAVHEGIVEPSSRMRRILPLRLARLLGDPTHIPAGRQASQGNVCFVVSLKKELIIALVVRSPLDTYSAGWYVRHGCPGLVEYSSSEAGRGHSLSLQDNRRDSRNEQSSRDSQMSNAETYSLHINS